MIVTDPRVYGPAIRARDADAERGHLWYCSAPNWAAEIVIATEATKAGQMWWDRRVDLMLDGAEPFGFVEVDCPPWPTVERIWPAAPCARASLALRLLGEEIDGSEEWGVLCDAILGRSGLDRMPPLRLGSAGWREESRICVWRRAGHAAVLLRRERHPICELLPTWP